MTASEPQTYLGTAGRIDRLSPRDKHQASRTLAALTRYRNPASSHDSGTRPGFEAVHSVQGERHSHSMVAGGLEITSRTTRLT